MHGLGNDFALLDARQSRLVLDAARIRAMADRHTGIGFDQLLILRGAEDRACAAAYGIANRDGSPAEQCGNGARCIGAWLHRAGIVAVDAHACLESPAGVVGVRVIDRTTVAVDMGEPEFAPARVPFAAAAAADSYPLEIADGVVRVAVVSMGNPHAVMQVADLDDPCIDTLGPAITSHPRFPQGVNAGFAQVVDAHHLRLRVHERGAGWTRACGSGACAAVAALRRAGRVGEQVQVELPGGALAVAWAGPDHVLWMTGPAAFSFDGEWLGE
jgi:diaminopimelate epimerase